MRIIAGNLGGRLFETPHGNRTHPMSDKMRGALFNALGELSGLSVLDGFAGSGALSFEAISRGASGALAIEVDKSAHLTIAKNIKDLGLEGLVKAVRANVSGWSDNNPQVQFDLVFCDPPYDHLQLNLLQKLVKHAKSGGLLVISWPGKLEPAEFKRLEILKKLDFGDSKLIFYRKGDA